MAKQVLNRKEYKDIKKMDHSQMSNFMEKIYMRGYEAGKKSASGLSEEETKEAILQIKGIGEKKANDIVQVLTQAQVERKMLTDG